MSSETADAKALQVEDVVAIAERYGHLALVGLLMVFMVWVRLINIDRFRSDDGSVTFSAVDPWYHWRTTEWTVQNYPWTMPYEVYTGFPTGNYVGQFGTLFDQIVATVALIIGLGSPTQAEIQLAALITVPILAALVAIPVYLIARRISDGNRFAGLAAVVVLALTPGEFLRRSMTGMFEHNVAEVLFMAIAVFAMIVALRTAEREKPIWELVRDREWEPLSTPAIYSALAGVAVSLYLWTWPPGVVFVGILGFFFAVQLSLDFVRGVSPDHVAFVGAVSMAVPTVFMLLMADVYSISNVTSFGLLQPTLSFLVAVGAVFMAWLAREWEARDLERFYYPAAIVGIAAGGLLVLSVVLPEFYSMLVNNLTRRLLPINPSTTGLTVQEVQPPENFVQRATREFGMGVYLLIAGLVLVVARPFTGQRFRAEHTLIVVWALFLTGMAMTQVRFWYYYVLPVAILSGYTVGQAFVWIDLKATDTIEDVEAYQVLTILLVLTVLFVPFALHDVTATDVGENAGPSYSSIIWEDSNQFMAENTPEPGNLYGADNADEVDYFGTYEYPDGGDYDYPEGAYGVMSWWDYGHLITTQAERIPHANPFQQHARSASAYLQAPSEDAANDVLDAIAAGEEPRLDANGNVTVEASEDGDEEIPYVMIDYQMAGSKFPAITQWTGPETGQYYESKPFAVGGEERGLPALNDAYYDTQLASLYIEDTRGMEHYRLVHEVDRYAYVGGRATRRGGYPFEARDLGQSWNQSAPLAALVDQARAQGTVFQGGFYQGHVVSVVKSFERVEGATLSGTVGEATGDNATAMVTLDLETNTGRTFTYTQETEVAADGSFEVTVPYATNDELGPEEGYTDTDVTANGSYEIYVGSGETYYRAESDVPESAIYEGETVSVDGFESVAFEDTPYGSSNESVNTTDGTTDDTSDDGSGDNTSNTTGRVDVGGVRVAGT